MYIWGEGVLLKSDFKNDEDMNLNDLDSSDMLLVLLRKLVYEGKINEAEDKLFKEIESKPFEGIYNVGIKFYNMLLEKSDEELNKANFSRDEVYQGISDIKKIIENKI